MIFYFTFPWLMRGFVNRAQSSLLISLAEVLSWPGSRVERLKRVATLLRENGGYRWVGLYDVDHGAGKAVNLVWDGPAAPEFPVFPLSQGLTGRAIAECKTVNVGNVSADPHYLTALATTRSEIIVPVFGENGTVAGTIDIESETQDAFDRATALLLEQCSNVLRPLWASRP